MKNKVDKITKEIDDDMWDIANDFDWVKNTKNNNIKFYETGDAYCDCDECERKWKEEIGGGWICEMCCGTDRCNNVKFDEYNLYNFNFSKFYNKWITGEFKDKDFKLIDSNTLWEITKNFYINNSLLEKSKIIADVKRYKNVDLKINNIKPELVEKVKWDKNKKLDDDEISKYIKIRNVDEGVVFSPVLLVCDECREKIGGKLDEKYKDNPMKKEKLEKVVFTLVDKHIDKHMNPLKKENNKTLEKER